MRQKALGHSPLERAGALNYVPVEQQHMIQRTYKIRGMDCAEEVNALKGTVGKLPGIGDLDFNLIDGTMTVQFDAGQVNEESILDAVRRAGLEAEAIDETCPSGVCAVEESWWRKRGRAVMCWSSGALVLVGFVTHAASARQPVACAGRRRRHGAS